MSQTRSRLAKRDLLAQLLREASDDLPVVTAWLSGAPRQRRTGVGWASLSDPPSPATAASVSVAEVDALLEQISHLAGPGSVTSRRDELAGLFRRLTGDEQDYLTGLLTGQLRQGALDAALLDAIATAFDVSLAAVRRAAFLGGSTPDVALAARSGEGFLDDFQLEVGRPVRPMLAGSAPDVATAWAEFGAGGPVIVDAKLDGIRVQIHRDGERVSVFSRSLDEVTERLPAVVEFARNLAVQSVVLDGEALLLDADGHPAPFQDSAARAASQAGDRQLTAVLFDVLHLDGVDLIDQPVSERLAVLAEITADQPGAVVQRVITNDLAVAQEFSDRVLAAGHEGVVLKAAESVYAAGRRGVGWIKVKPRRTLDLVVLAVEWGSGRRKGKLSNIHLGARDPEHPGEFVMVGKTFKGMTDEILAWQTERFTQLETGTDGYVVRVRPEQVVEIAIDGVQRSRRYPGQVALRFARVVRYRFDRTPADADTIDTVRAFGPS